MDAFATDKPFYEMDSTEEELWDAELDTTMQDVLRLGSNDWNFLDKDLPSTILQDKLMSTEAMLGMRPIKSEHSYSLASDGDSLPDSPISSSHRIDDIDDECFPAVSMRDVEGRLSPCEIEIKDEPISETDSLHSSCPSSPHHIIDASSLVDTYFTTADLDLDAAPTEKRSKKRILLTTSSLFTNGRLQLPIKLEPGTAFHLPPTPPSFSSSEESEDNISISHPSSPVAVMRSSKSSSSSRILLSHHATTTRQPIHTPLISSQPKGSTGNLILTEEEKRTLVAEGYPVPTRLPLTKAEEKSLKKIRRKIKNKISAQESRRKKKEYMDQLERKVELLVSENNDYRKQVDVLETSNSSLAGQVAKLQALLARTHPRGN